LNPSPPELWEGVLRRLGAETAPYTLDAWLRPLEARLEGDRLRLHCPSAFHRDRIRDRWLPAIARHLEAERGSPLEIELVVTPVLPGARPGARQGPRSAAPPARGNRPQRRLLPDATPEETVDPPATRAHAAPREQPELPYRFANFVVGTCNALAREASVALAQGRQRAANPLYLTSASGLGKTHLARAITAEAAPERVLYVSAEAFTSDFTRSIRSRQMDRFIRRYRYGCRVLVMEDVQFLEAKKKTQLELFHTLSHLLDAGARVVLTGDRMPRDIDGLDPRLCSQMASGLVAEIEAPDAAVRREILRQRAAAGGVRLPDDCLDLLVGSLRGSVRDLEGVLIQLVASASLLKRSIDLPLTRRALHKLSPMRAERSLSPDQVIDAVAAFFRKTPETLARRSRRRDVLWPRQLAMVLCRRYTDASHAEIAQRFGRQHTAVRNAVSVVERTMLEHAPRRYQVEALSARIESLVAARSD
jgi:chromosomal replication initiator protein